jgi:hypothetical protein
MYVNLYNANVRKNSFHPHIVRRLPASLLDFELPGHVTIDVDMAYTYREIKTLIVCPRLYTLGRLGV